MTFNDRVLPREKSRRGRVPGRGVRLQPRGEPNAIAPRPSHEPQTDLDLLLDSRKCFGREHTYRRVLKQCLFESRDLITLRPTIKIQIGIAFLDGDAHAKCPALDG